MKLLGWMHRKFRQNSSEPLRDFVISQPPSDDQQQYFPRTNINKPFKQAQLQRDLNKRKSVSESSGVADSSRADEYYELDDPVLSISEIFPGFLAIGTLGSSSDPATPKFSISIDNITATEAQVTENELKLINDELEKVLEVEPNDTASSRRNSYVSMGRTSHGMISSTVTDQSSNVISDDVVNNGGGVMVCPLQGYLFGSAVELSETTIGKKENRTSLGELFQRSKLLSEEVGARSCDKDDDQKQVEKKAGDKYGMQLIKKKLKKRMLNAASRNSSTAAAGVFDFVSTHTKLHKILHMFNRKVYPETTTMAKEKWDHKAEKNDKKKKTTIDGALDHKNNGEKTFTDGDIMIFPKKLILNQTLQRFNSQSIPPQFSDDDDDADSNWNKEQWIKSDAEYLVLEL